MGRRNDPWACVSETVTGKKGTSAFMENSPLGTVKTCDAGEAPSSGCPHDWKFGGQMLEGVSLPHVLRCTSRFR